jgi:serine protease Do
MRKPDKDPLTYEKPLPLDLIPFIERNDVYRSMGTAFSLGNATYVTAAHVIGAGIDSQYGAPAVRRSDGKVFEIDRILKFSQHEDFVVFSVRDNPAPVGLAVNLSPKLDEAVLAVGNALGEGIVIRDGLFTSETPEEQDGRWKWIRFSAAASPGNSGGPLCDAEGRVVGIVLRKSPNENLNYSLPIGRVLDGEPMKARFDQKVLVSLPYMHGTFTYAYKDEFALPLTWPLFVESLTKHSTRHIDESRRQLLQKYADTMFPKGQGAQAVLFDLDANDIRPRLITQHADGTWVAERPPFHDISLPGDGSVGYADTSGARLISLVRSDAAFDDAFYADSSAFMDLALKAMDLRRAVGTDQVRVTSLGVAQSDGVYTDPYGRKWQERVWAVPFLDVYLVGELLPTPEGYAGILMFSPSAVLQAVKEVGRLFTAQLDVSYRGDLAQWRAALRRRALLPAALAQVKLDFDKVSGWTLQTPRFVSSIAPQTLALTEKSPLTLTMGFMQDGPQTLWDIQGVRWDQDGRKEAAVELWRRMQPPGEVKLESRNLFDSIRHRRNPYDGSLSRETSAIYSASSVLDVPGKKTGAVSSDLKYVVTVHLVGQPRPADATAALTRITDATRLLERGVGEDLAPVQRQSISVDNVLAGMARTAPDRDSLADQASGRDIRGRLMSEDLRQFMQRLRADFPGMAADSTASDQTGWTEEQKRRLAWFKAYWAEYPALTHNRDLFVDFLAKNQLQATTAHGPEVMSAERALLASLQGDEPSEEWARRARALREAYAEERSVLVKSSRSTIKPDQIFSPRTTPCPAAAKTTTGTAHAGMGSNTASLLDYWPTESRRLGEEGTVIAALHISETGCATEMAILGSSGSEMLDDTVLKYLESMQFVPAGPGGRATKSQVMVPIVFKLD